LIDGVTVITSPLPEKPWGYQRKRREGVRSEERGVDTMRLVSYKSNEERQTTGAPDGIAFTRIFFPPKSCMLTTGVVVVVVVVILF
jgi:hypothetical protein